MISAGRPTWYLFCEKAFSFNFVAFSFVMFSCWFPTGFSATFSTLAFIFALPIFVYKGFYGQVYMNLYEKVALVLFGWLLLSVLWSQTSIIETLSHLSEYRIYFLLPVFIHVLADNAGTQKSAVIAATVGATIALITSYGLGFNWWYIEGAQSSLANRIFHGFIMAILLLGILLYSREVSGAIRILCWILASLIIFNVINIENGRTGYLLMLTVALAVAGLTWSKKRFFIFCVVVIVGTTAAYPVLDRFKHRVDQTVRNVTKMVVHDDYRSSAGLRLEYYKNAIEIGVENPLLGVGVGDVEGALREKFDTGEMRAFTDNVHNEFLNMLMAGGIPALMMFGAFIFSLTGVGWQHRTAKRFTADTLIILSAVLFISALFNSTIKDYGEKHVLIIILSLIGARLRTEGSREMFHRSSLESK